MSIIPKNTNTETLQVPKVLNRAKSQAASQNQAQKAPKTHYNHNYNLKAIVGSDNLNIDPGPLSSPAEDYNYKGCNSDAKQVRYDLMRYAEAVNRCPSFIFARKLWDVKAGAIVNGIKALGYHKVIEIFLMVKDLPPWRFDQKSDKTPGQQRGAYFLSCLMNEAKWRGAKWGHPGPNH